MTDTQQESRLIAPHGGRLVDRYAPEAGVDAIRERATALPAVKLGPRELSDAHMIAQGVFSPLEGFLASVDYRNVVDSMRLASGVAWSLPVTLSVGREQAQGLREGQELALQDAKGELVGVMELRESFDYDKRHEAERVYRTTEEAHAGVAGLYAQGDVLLGGPVMMLPGIPPIDPAAIPHYRTPAETRSAIDSMGWRRVVGFQTRNPVHRAHEYIQKCALEMVDGLLLHPLVGETKSDDIPADVRMRCYEVLLEHYYPADRVLLSVFPAFMRYAGPREAIFHALARKNYGCSHFIVGRDHAGVGGYYGTYDAQHIFDEFSPEELGITPLFFENTFYSLRNQGMASTKTSNSPPEDRVFLSGTQVREMLSRGEMPPPEFTRPEVAQVLMEAYKEV
jgi:sulfate adenylyltransferase